MKKSHLLIDEPALQVLPSLAVAIGVEEAIVLQQLHWWLNNPNNTGRVDENGDKWVYNTYEKWKKDNFPFWSVDKIKRIFLNLEKGGVVISAQLDAKKHDMQKFYRIDFDVLCTMERAILPPSNSAELHDVNKNTETTTENTTYDRKAGMQASKERNARQRTERESRDPVEEMLKASQDFEPLVAMQKRIEAALKMNLEREWDLPKSDWHGYDKLLVRREKETGQTIERFMSWFKSDEFRSKGDIWLKPKKIEQLWQRAFENAEANLDLYPTI
jgi:hypothetical protein